MKKIREFYNVIQYVMSRELSWYGEYVTKSVTEDYRAGFMAGIKAMRNLITDIYIEFAKDD